MTPEYHLTAKTRLEAARANVQSILDAMESARTYDARHFELDSALAEFYFALRTQKTLEAAEVTQ